MFMSREQLIFLAVEAVLALLGVIPWLTPSDLPYATRWAITGIFALLLVAAALWYFRASVLQRIRSAFYWCYHHGGITITLLVSASAVAEYFFTRNLHSLWPFLFIYLSLLILRFGREEIPSELPLTFVHVPARESRGVDTQIDLSLGQKLVIVASGEISIDAGKAWYSPSGIITRPPELRNQTIQGRNMYIDSEPAGALVGWIGQGNQSKAFPVGGSREVVATEAGHLFLAVNDVRGAYVDNVGEFWVQIVLLRPDTTYRRSRREEVQEYLRARREELAEYVSREPDDAKARYEIAEYQARLLDYASALHNLERAIELDEGYREKAKKSSAFHKLLRDSRFRKLIYGKE